MVDTNIFVSAIMNRDGAPRQVIRLCLQDIVVPLMGNALFEEYEDVCRRPGLFKDALVSPDERDALFEAFLTSCRFVPIYYLWPPNLRDEADNHLIELAVAGGANVIVTANKRDFTNAELIFPALKIQTAGEFLNERNF